MPENRIPPSCRKNLDIVQLQARYIFYKYFVKGWRHLVAFIDHSSHLYEIVRHQLFFPSALLRELGSLCQDHSISHLTSTNTINLHQKQNMAVEGTSPHSYETDAQVRYNISISIRNIHLLRIINFHVTDSPTNGVVVVVVDERAKERICLNGHEFDIYVKFKFNKIL